MSSRQTEQNSPVKETTIAVYPPCLDPRCLREGKNRGLCSSHASRMWVLIQNEELTEEEAVANGKMLPRKRTFTEWALEFKRDIAARRAK